MHFSLPFMLFFFIILGLIFGSFLNVLIYRLPQNQSIIFPSSYCPNCKTSIRWFYNIPLISFLFLRGTSNCCNKKISIRYPIVELISSFLWIWTYFYINGLINQVMVLFILSCFIVILFTDYSHFLIPIELNVLIFLFSLFLFYIEDKDIMYHFFSMILLSGYFLILMLVSNYLLKKNTMGYGDIILIGVITFWLGLIDGLLIIFIASLLSIIHWLILKMNNKDNSIILPFGSTMALATILIFIIKNTLQIETNFF
tara:strand:+ start:2724 stop:3491 length:768 start_codon:yes stop_codon:yes gene_type:complete